MDELELLDYRRRVFALYARVRDSDDPRAAWEDWRATRDELFATHPQSALPASGRGGFGGLPYYGYDPAARVLADVAAADGQRFEIGTSGPDAMAFTRFATARFALDDEPLELELYWLEGYGGGLFVPVADATSGNETYGAGRYVLDTVKGADLGMRDGRLVLDFNFAYQPSCAYDPRWACPLAPPANRLGVAIRAGERYVSPR